MQKIAIIQISEEGKNIARLIQSQVFAQKNEAEIISRVIVGKRWKDFDAFCWGDGYLCEDDSAIYQG